MKQNADDDTGSLSSRLDTLRKLSRLNYSASVDDVVRADVAVHHI